MVDGNITNATVNAVAQNITGNETIGSALIYISDKLGMGITQVYNVYVQVQFALALVNILQIILPLIGIGIFNWWLYRMYKTETEDNIGGDDLALFFTIAIIGSILILIIGAILIGAIGNSVVVMMYPQYGAIQNMLSLLHG